MRIEDAFIQLYRSYNITSAGETVVCSRPDVAMRLRCSERNALLLLRKMEAQAYIRWDAGRGRGHKSHLTFLINNDDIVMSIAKARVREGKLHEGFRMVKERSTDSQAKHQFLEWVFARLGYMDIPSSESVHQDVLRIPFYRPLATLSPPFVTRRTEAHVVHQVFDTLVRVNPHTQEVEPHLAHYHESDASYTRWRFYLRKGVLFHNGRHLSAYDVADSLNRLRSLEGPHRPLFQGVSAIRVLSELELEVQLTEADAMFPHLLAQTAASIQPQSTGNEAHAVAGDMMVGTGPFTLRRNDESMIVLEAFPLYFLGRPQLDRIEIWIVPTEPSTERQLHQDGVHYVARLLDDETKQGTWRRMQSIETGSRYLTLNLDRQGPQQHAGFRAWLAAAIDPQRLLTDAGRDNRIARSFVPSDEDGPHGTSGYENAGLSTVPMTDWPPDYNGEVLRLLTYDHRDHVADAKWIADRLEAHGVSVDVKVVPAPDIGPDSLGEADMALSAEVFDNDITLSYLNLLQATNSPVHNHLGCAFKQEFAAAAKAVKAQSLPFNQRLLHMRALERQILDSHALLLLYHLNQHAAVHPTLQGAVMDSLGWLDYRKLWFQPIRRDEG